jgi:SAM-dependent methyltransferase
MTSAHSPQNVSSPATHHASLVTSLHEHLTWWGLRHFTSDAAYFQWQRAQLSSADLTALNQQVTLRQAPCAGVQEDVAFYDLAALPHIVPVLYSQRYDYYRQVGPRVAAHLGEARTTLDVGCGVGILTTFSARRFPDRSFVGIDRSPASIQLAERKSKELGFTNIRFECLDLDREPLQGGFDLIIATHALLQAERDPGVPSRSWQTFERVHDPEQQRAFEQRTSLGNRLDHLRSALASNGRLILFEKTRQLSRRVPFQRAFVTRGWHLLLVPEPVRYVLVEEVTDDGPFYVLGRGRPGGDQPQWDELPEPDEGIPLDLSRVRAERPEGEKPLYENHHPSAQTAWERLQDRTVTNETTRQEPDGRQFHAELGTADGLIYLYCANTFDQRQLVLIEPARASLLETYYREIVEGVR